MTNWWNYGRAIAIIFVLFDTEMKRCWRKDEEKSLFNRSLIILQRNQWGLVGRMCSMNRCNLKGKSLRIICEHQMNSAQSINAATCSFVSYIMYKRLFLFFTNYLKYKNYWNDKEGGGGNKIIYNTNRLQSIWKILSFYRPYHLILSLNDLP